MENTSNPSEILHVCCGLLVDLPIGPNMFGESVSGEPAGVPWLGGGMFRLW